MPLAKHLRKVFGDSVFSEPGIIFLPGFSASTLVIYALTGMLVLLVLKNMSTPVTKQPPSKFSTLKVCARGLGLTGLSAISSLGLITTIPIYSNIDTGSNSSYSTTSTGSNSSFSGVSTGSNTTPSSVSTGSNSTISNVATGSNTSYSDVA